MGLRINAVILAVLVTTFSILIPNRVRRLRLHVRGFAGLLGGLGGLTVFFLFTFIACWDAYHAQEATGAPVEYPWRHRTAPEVIRILGEMETSTPGTMFGVVGLGFLAVAVFHYRALFAGDRT